MQVLLTRPLEESRDLADALEAEGIAALIWPLTRIAPIASALKLPLATDALLFTSANGVRALAALTPRRDLPALCVGPATVAAARKAGFLNCLDAAGDAHALADLARRSGLRNFFHARGRDTAGDLKGALAATGQQVTEVTLYEALEVGPASAPVASALRRGSVDLVTIWSRRNGEILARHLAALGPRLGQTGLLAISNAAAAPLAAAGFHRQIIADSPDAAAMIRAIRVVFAALRQENPE